MYSYVINYYIKLLREKIIFKMISLIKLYIFIMLCKLNIFFDFWMVNNNRNKEYLLDWIYLVLLSKKEFLWLYNEWYGLRFLLFFFMYF